MSTLRSCAPSLTLSVTRITDKHSGDPVQVGEDPPPRGAGAAPWALVKAPPFAHHPGPWVRSQPLPMASVLCQVPRPALLGPMQSQGRALMKVVSRIVAPRQPHPNSWKL